MMNFLAISLVLTTLVTAGFFNPNPENNKKKEDVILKEGPRVVVVEFDKEDGTKILISPQQEAEIPKGKSGYVSDLKDKLHEKAEEASSVLPNIGQGISSPYVNQENGEIVTKPSAKDVVCDAFGKCKEKFASALGKTKDKVSEKAHETADKVDEVKEGAKGAAEKVKESIKDAYSEASDKVKEKAKDVIDTTKRKKGEVESEISEKAKELKEKSEQVKDSVKEGAKKVKEEGKKELKDILGRGREFFYDVFAYIFSLENLRTVMLLVHFLGFAVAYGMCIWVTFVSSYVLARALPRQQFALVQSKIYLVYFKAMAYCVGAAFLGHLLSQKRRLYASSAEAVQGFNLLASIAMLLVNLLYLEPRATKVMFERLKLEKEEGRGRDIFNVEPSSRGVDSVLDPTCTKITSQTTTTTSKPAEKSPEVEAVVKPQVVRLSQKLKKLNSYSSFLNVLTLMALSHHLVHLTQLVDA
ncbi:uncharacterized protein LOC107807812 [Nicotiana tabacum]|uniref:Uncharacterized protein LOC107807812 n=1 Tax=Nicotiana tabacum TaxID=4097 RepID=A0A1S4BFS1_TOBAC|nr:uncharacterized protein LOC104095114 isoform X1 [Nicotiana tomentosiformis]XP_016487732.1 PREDICTED: uncharacterized protein LOC107807812 [Nicotiana tabacum]